jgi:lipopolysaccharide transport system ATP-binding protein
MKAYISAKDVEVKFPVYENSNRSFKKTFLHVSTGGRVASDATKRSTVTALRDINFDFFEGERIGLIGQNGSGKTTLLRLISGVYVPSVGRIESGGKVSSLLDLSMGLDPDATGYENIYLRGILDGFSPKQIRARAEEIAEFSELGDFLTLPVRTYSSGMVLRLAFSISTSIDAEIIVMDEWLSVGDASFVSKAEKRLLQLVDNSSILVLASHNIDLISRVCTRKIVLDKGMILMDEKI